MAPATLVRRLRLGLPYWTFRLLALRLLRHSGARNTGAPRIAAPREEDAAKFR